MLPARILVVMLMIGAVGFAGCLDSTPDLDDGDPVDELTDGLFARAEPLWHAPQDFPHPMFGWPTLTNPPDAEGTPKWWEPIPAADMPDVISGLQHFAESGAKIPMGGGFAAFGSLVSFPTYEHGTYIVDISDPSDATVLSVIDNRTRGAVMIPYPDGRLVTVYSTSSSLIVYDITDPRNPVYLDTIQPTQGSHKVGVVPGTPIVYNAASSGGRGSAQEGTYQDPYLGNGRGVTEIYDLSDPENYEHVMDFANGYSCHHVYFHIDPDSDKYRSVCAGIQETQIWDIADPRDPQIISRVTMPLGGDAPPLAVSPAMLSHFSILSNDGSVLIVGDETGGGAAPGCDVYVHQDGTTVSGPIGNLWFYDLSDESDPQLMGWMSPTHHYESNPPAFGQGPSVRGVSIPAACTAHHGRLVPDPTGERDLLAMAFYGAGVVLVDFSDPANPFIVDQWNPSTNTWEVWYYNGYLITGDLNRGLDVLVFE